MIRVYPWSHHTAGVWKPRFLGDFWDYCPVGRSPVGAPGLKGFSGREISALHDERGHDTRVRACPFLIIPPRVLLGPLLNRFGSDGEPLPRPPPDDRELERLVHVHGVLVAHDVGQERECQLSR